MGFLQCKALGFLCGLSLWTVVLGDAEVLAAAIQSKLGVASVTIGDVGPVIGAHSGLGTLALFFLGKER